jgi:hypothetical protein
MNTMKLRNLYESRSKEGNGRWRFLTEMRQGLGLCDKDGNDTESDGDGQDDPKTRPLDQQQLAELTDLTSHTARFEFETTKMEVAGLLQWHYTDTARTSKLVYDTKYQRNQNAGWDPEKKSQFLKTVMAGQAATPFVVNVRRKEARLLSKRTPPLD